MSKISNRFKNNAINLSQILQFVLEVPNGEFTNSDKQKMGKIGDFLESLNVLRKADFSGVLECPNYEFCGGTGEVREVSGKFFVDCSECGTLEKINPEDQRMWLFDWEKFLSFIKKEFQVVLDLEQIKMLPLSEIFLWKEDGISIDKNILEEALKNSKTQTVKKDLNAPKINLPENTKWEHLTIKFLNGTDIEILCNSQVLKTTNSLEMGFKPKKGEQENVSWVFLKLLAKQPDNQISWGDKGASTELRTRKKATVRALKNYFGMNDDPFFPTKKFKGYKPRFQLISEEKKDEPFFDTNWDNYEKPKGIATADL